MHELDNIIEQHENVLRRIQDQVGEIVNQANREGRSNLTVAEDNQCEKLKRGYERVERKLNETRELRDTLASQDAGFGSVTRTNAGQRSGARTTSFSIGRNERTYRPDEDPHGRNFLLDVIRGQMFGDPTANQRLSRHMQEETTERPGINAYRTAGDTTTVNWSGLVVPQYLTDMVAPAVANMRPFADAACNKHDLPAEGMSVNISRVTTSTLAGLQSAELATLPTQSADDTLLTIPVQTAGGWANVSRQAIERGTGVDQTLMQDLFARYATDLDNQLINQTVTGALAVAGSTDVSSGLTPQVYYSKIVGAANSITTSLLNQAKPSHVVMHPRRWNYLASQVTTSWPLISNQDFNNGPGAGGLGVQTSSEYGSGVVGRLPNGLLVVSDANMPTNITADTIANTDATLVVAGGECHLWEDPNQPAFIRAEAPNSPQLGVLLTVYGWYSYTFARYAGAVQKIIGGVFTNPTF